MILGIDLGTSNSMAAVYKDGETILVQSRTGNYQIPSVVSMDEDGVFYTGDLAKERKLNYPEYTVDMFKRSMGSEKMFSIGDKEVKAEELSAVLLKGIKEDAQAFVGEELTDVVISVPAFFTNPQRKAVMCAGELAGFNVRKIVNEPTAAAMAYGIQNMETDNEEETVIVVLDLGGGTFDISVMEVSDNVMEVVAICGDNKLGGGDFTQRLMDIFLKENNIHKTLSVEEYATLWKKAEVAKIKLSKDGKAEMNCNIDGKHYTLEITEEEYEKACFDLLEKIRKLTMKAVEESKYHPWEIDEIIMVGGGTKLSIVCKMIEKMTGKPLEHKINPDEAVVLGTAIQGALLEKDETVKDLVMTDICPYYLGLIIRDGGNLDINEYFDVLIPKNVTIPARATTVHFSKPALWGLDVCQSEDRCGTNPIPMGHISYRLPDVGTPRVEVHKTVIYDANGIMHVEIYIPSTDVTYEKTIVNDECEMTIEKAKERAKQLKYMNLSAKGNDKDNLLIARAERVYAECTGSIREHINSLIGLFETALNSGKQSDIKNARERLLDAVNRYDSEII